MNKYVAFLRGINVGGNKLVKMEELRNCFESIGFQHIRTLLASGNVLFDTPNKDIDSIIKQIEEKLNERFGHKIKVMLRTPEQIQYLIDHNPFDKVVITPQTRLY